MASIRTHSEQELETNQSQNKEKDLSGSIVQRNTIYIHGRSQQSKFY